MNDESPTVSELLARPFTIHSINNYTYIGLTSFASMLELTVEQLRRLIRIDHFRLERQLAAHSIDYADLRGALTPRPNKHEVAFLFDSTATGSDFYGRDVSRAWLAALRAHGPTKTTIGMGDILLPLPRLVWRELHARLVGPEDFPYLSPEQYYIVYVTNMSPAQIAGVDAALRDASHAYLGYVDCSTWTPLKFGMLLPQYALRHDDVLLGAVDDMGGTNHAGYPVEDYGFHFVGVEDQLYSLFLDHRIDNGVPGWASEDSSYALAALGGRQDPLDTMVLELDDRRFGYLVDEKDGHGVSIRRAGLSSLTRDDLAAAVQDKLAAGLIFNLRFVTGTRDGEPAPENDALMFTVQVEFPDESGVARRYQVGVKYAPASHTGQLVTFH